MIKKFISVLICISVLTSLMAVCTVNAEVALTDKARVLLEALDIISEDGALGEVVTRGKFAEMASKIVLEDMDEIANYKSSYPDVGEYDEFYPYVSLLSTKNYVVGFGDGNFHPESVLTAEQAAKILVKIIGEGISSFEGESYITIAGRIGLFSGLYIADSSSMTVGEAAVMIYNALGVDVAKLHKMSGSKFSFDGIYREKVLNIYETTGIVSSDGKTALSGPTKIRENEIVINDLVMTNESGNNNLIGRRIVGYYRHNNSSDKNTLIAAAVTSEEVNIEAQNIVGYKSLTYTYLIDMYDKKEKKAELKPGFAVIYNGVSVYDGKLFDDKKMSPKFGSITLVNSDGDSKFDCLIIEEYEPVSVIGVDSRNKIVYSEGDEAYPLEKGESVLYDANGNKIAVSDIKLNNIVSIYRSLSGEFIKLVVSTKTVEGTINVLDADYITVNGGDYRYVKEIQPDIECGSEGTFYLDHKNVIVVFDKSFGAGTMYAYLYDVYVDNRSKSVEFYVYTQDNRNKTYIGAETLNVDGRKYKKANYGELYNYLKAGEEDIKKQLIVMQLNSDGDVSKIDTVGTVESDNSLQIMPGTDNKQLIFQVLAQTFEGKAMVDIDTKVFIVPSEFDKTQIRVDNYKSLRNDSPYYVTAYTTKKDKLVADAVVIEVESTGIDVNHPYYSLEQLPFVVTDIETALNKDDSTVYKLSLTNHAQSVEMYTTDLDVLTLTRDSSDVKVSVGDIIRYGYDKDGAINKGNILLLFDEDCDYFENNGLHAGTYDSYRQVLRAHRAYVDKIDGTNVRFKYEETADVADMDSYLLDTCKVFIYERNNNKKKNALVQGTVADLIVNDEVVFYASSGRLMMAVIYR